MVIALVALTLQGTASTVASATTIDNDSQVQTYVINQNSKTKSQTINFDPSVSFVNNPKKSKIHRFIRKFLRKHFGIR